MHRGWHHRGYLPHLDAPDVVQAVTFRLADGLPTEVVLRLKAQWRDDAAVLRRLVAHQLDAGHGRCVLANLEAMRIVRAALLHGHQRDYRLLTWVVIPNHVHVVVALRDHSLVRIVQSWKSYTAGRINSRFDTSGRLWQPDYYDRRIRDDAHLAAVDAYVHGNPVKAGLVARAEDWPFSSARNAELELRAPGSPQRSAELQLRNPAPSLDTIGRAR